MAKIQLSSVDFRRWKACPRAAFYGWRGRASKSGNDPFLTYLCEEATTVRKVAKRLFPDGQVIDVKDGPVADKATRNALQQEDATVFDGTILEASFIIRPHVLIRKGSDLYVIGIKSKSGNLQQHQEGKLFINCYGDIRAAYREVILDLAFEVDVLRRAFPDLAVIPYLLLPEEGCPASSSEVDTVRLEKEKSTIGIIPIPIKERRKASVLKFFRADVAIEKIRKETAADIDSMAKAWNMGAKPEPRLRYQCRNCEFRLNNGQVANDGFHECWGSLADPSPHIFDLHQLYSLKAAPKSQALLADSKILHGKTSLYDIVESELHGEHAQRQRIQLRYQRGNREWISPTLGGLIGNLRWPIAFLDFETITTAIPWYPKIQPYQVLPFQFSCHVLRADGSMTHKEWLNTRDRIPTLPFIRNLMKSLEGVGSILVYTDYEVRILKEALELLAQFGGETQEERVWIFDLLHSGRIVDQHEWVYNYYFHPEMGGRTSIKVVLPAVWHSNTSLHTHKYFSRYFREENGKVLGPYKTLPSASFGKGKLEVREGCGAMAAYREMIRGQGAHCGESREIIASLLRNYVALDTASQWIILEHWKQKIRNSNPSEHKISSNQIYTTDSTSTPSIPYVKETSV